MFDWVLKTPIGWLDRKNGRPFSPVILWNKSIHGRNLNRKQTSCLQSYVLAKQYFFTYSFIKKSNVNSIICSFNPFFLNALLLYPLKASENFTVFWCFQGVEKGCTGSEWSIERNIQKTVFSISMPPKSWIRESTPW